jgi:hypothetical protein
MCFFYNQKHDEVPAPISTGEILIAYHMKITARDFDLQGWSHWTTRWKLIGPGYDMRTLAVDELAEVKKLQSWWNTMGGVAGAKGDIIKRNPQGQVLNEEGPTRGKKAAYIRDMKEGHFYDIMGEVFLILD